MRGRVGVDARRGEKGRRPIQAARERRPPGPLRPGDKRSRLAPRIYPMLGQLPARSYMPDAPSLDVALFQAAIDTAREAVFWMDGEGRFAYVNEQACRLLGYARDELL